MLRARFRRLLVAALLLAWAGAAAPQMVTVRTTDELRAALRDPQPGTTILLEPGEYAPGPSIEGVSGSPDRPIVIGAVDPGDPPRFVGGSQAIHLIDCSFLTLRLHISGCSQNGINADDGCSFDTPARGLAFENLTIERIGPAGNHDALKLSGVDDFVVRGCTFRGWGGSAIDMVGCHDGRIVDCTFEGLAGYTPSSGVQLKGRTARVRVLGSFFNDAGLRAVNLGGSTGLEFFRPQGADYEAREIEVAGNRFVGSSAPLAWVTADGGHVHHNTFYLPRDWTLRILQEQPVPPFIPCRDGVFEENLVVFDGSLRTHVNVGPDTASQTFVFRCNAWFRADGSSTPNLPVVEIDGIYGVDPELIGAGTATMRVGSDNERLRGIGADAWSETPRAAVALPQLY